MLVQSRFPETRFAETRFAETRFAETLTLTLTLISANRVSANREDTGDATVYFATTANYHIVCWSAILATAWLLVLITHRCIIGHAPRPIEIACSTAAR